MKKNKFSVLGMLAMVLAFGLVVAGCDDGNNNNGGGEPYDGPKTIKITGYSGDITAYSMEIFSEQSGANVHPPTAEALEEIDGQTITYTVKYWAPGRDTGLDWMGIGKFYIVIECEPAKDGRSQGGAKYVYSVDGTNPVLVDIKDEVTVLEWAKFIWLVDYSWG